MANEKNQNPGNHFGATVWTALPIQPLWPIFEVNWLDWHCFLAGSSKTAPRILIFLIAIGDDYSYEVKNSEIWAPVFFKHNKTFTTTVWKEWLSVCHENQNMTFFVPPKLGVQTKLFDWQITWRLYALKKRCDSLDPFICFYNKFLIS